MVLVTKELITRIIDEIAGEYSNDYQKKSPEQRQKLFTIDEFKLYLHKNLAIYENMEAKNVETFKTRILSYVNNLVLEELRKANEEINNIYKKLLRKATIEPKYKHVSHLVGFRLSDSTVTPSDENIKLINNWIQKSIDNITSIKYESRFSDWNDAKYAIPIDIKEVLAIIDTEKKAILEKTNKPRQISHKFYFIFATILFMIIIIPIILILTI